MTDSEANQSKASIENIDIKETRVQKWAVRIAISLLAGALLAYLANFHGGVSGDTSVWGEFGDYLGGLVNPFVGLLTIWLLSDSLRQNQIALAQARDELKLASQALIDAKNMQAATEAALKQQTAIAAEAKDMNNAIALFQEVERQYDDVVALVKQHEGKEPPSPDLLKYINLRGNIGEARDNLSRILNNEIGRLLKLHLPGNSKN